MASFRKSFLLENHYPMMHKKCSFAGLPAIRAEPVESQLGPDDLEPGSQLQFPDGGGLKVDISVHNLVAVDADQVGMGIQPVAIIVAVIVQGDLHHLAHFLEQCQCLVNGRRAHGGEPIPNFFIQLGGARMPLTHCDQPNQFDSLGGQPEFALLQRGN